MLGAGCWCEVSEVRPHKAQLYLIIVWWTEMFCCGKGTHLVVTAGPTSPSKHFLSGLTQPPSLK